MGKVDLRGEEKGRKLGVSDLKRFSKPPPALPNAVPDRTQFGAVLRRRETVDPVPHKVTGATCTPSGALSSSLTPNASPAEPRARARAPFVFKTAHSVYIHVLRCTVGSGGSTASTGGDPWHVPTTSQLPIPSPCGFD